MAVQTSTTSQLENASMEMIKEARYTEEHNAPMVNLVETFQLKRGSDTMVIPKVGQMTMTSLNEGQDIVDEEDIGMTTTSTTASEVGAKVIVTDKLMRQNTASIFPMVGRQLGEGMARRKNEDLLGLFAALNGGIDLGSAGFELTAQNATRIVSHAKANKFGAELRVVHHPTAIFRLSTDLSTVGSGTIRPIPAGFSARRLENFWTGIRLSGVPFFETGDITRDASDDAVGAIFNRRALGMMYSVRMSRERQRDASLRAWEVVIVADYSAFEIDDTLGAPVTMDAADAATT